MDHNDLPRRETEPEEFVQTENQPIYSGYLPPEEPPVQERDPRILRYTTTPSLYKTQWKLCRPKFRWLPFILVLVGLILIPTVSSLMDAEPAFPSGLLFGLMIFVLCANSVIKKAYLRRFDPEKPLTYEMVAEEGRLKITAYRGYGDEGMISESTVATEDITYVKKGGGICAFMAHGETYSIPLPLLYEHPEISALIPPARRSGATAHRPTSFGKRLAINLISWRVFAFTLFTLFGFILITALVSAIATMPVESAMLIASLVCIWIPIACLVLGIVFQARYRRGVQNIVMGSVILFFLGVYLLAGVASVVSIQNHDPDGQITLMEQEMGIDLPTGARSSYTGGSSEEFFRTSYSLSEEDEAVMAELIKNEPWIDELSTVQEEVFDLYESESEDRYFIIWNRDTGEFSALPTEDGTYRFVTITYDVVSGYLSYVLTTMEFKS